MRSNSACGSAQAAGAGAASVESLSAWVVSSTPMPSACATAPAIERASLVRTRRAGARDATGGGDETVVGAHPAAWRSRLAIPTGAVRVRAGGLGDEAAAAAISPGEWSPSQDDVVVAAEGAASGAGVHADGGERVARRAEEPVAERQPAGSTSAGGGGASAGSVIDEPFGGATFDPESGGDDNAGGELDSPDASRTGSASDATGGR